MLMADATRRPLGVDHVKKGAAQPSVGGKSTRAPIASGIHRAASSMGAGDDVWFRGHVGLKSRADSPHRPRIGRSDWLRHHHLEWEVSGAAQGRRRWALWDAAWRSTLESCSIDCIRRATAHPVEDQPPHVVRRVSVSLWRRHDSAIRVPLVEDGEKDRFTE
jgi:hypothetical protein